MIEALIVFGVVAGLVLLGVAGFALSLEGLLLVAASCIGAGFVIGLPAGTLYHVRLYRSLAQRGPVPRSFWLRPTGLHDRLSRDEWRSIAPCFIVGGSGFALIVLGCVVMLLGVLRG
jgi:hypothetical protein